MTCPLLFGQVSVELDLVRWIKELGLPVTLVASAIVAMFWAVPVVWRTLFAPSDGIIRAWIASREGLIDAEMRRRDQFIQSQIEFTATLSLSLKQASDERRAMVEELSAMREELAAMREELALLRHMFMASEDSMGEMERMLADALEALIAAHKNHG